jgi:hypothetical protein
MSVRHRQLDAVIRAKSDRPYAHGSIAEQVRDAERRAPPDSYHPFRTRPSTVAGVRQKRCATCGRSEKRVWRSKHVT